MTDNEIVSLPALKRLNAEKSGMYWTITEDVARVLADRNGVVLPPAPYACRWMTLDGIRLRLEYFSKEGPPEIRQTPDGPISVPTHYRVWTVYPMGKATT